MSDRPNILLLTLDAVRPDRLALFGGSVKTPNLKRLTSRSLVCAEAWSQGPVTWISHASVFSGLWPHHHGLTDIQCQLDPAVTTLAERLRGAGYRTAGWPATAVAGKGMGLDKGFERFSENYLTSMPFGDRTFPDRAGEPFAFVDFEAVLEQWRRWRDESDQPWMAWLHYFNIHNMPESLMENLGPPEKLRRKVHGKRFWEEHSKEDVDSQFYDAKLAWADVWVGKILDLIDLDRTIIAVFSDHGEGLDYDYPDHDQCREEELKVLLMISTAGKARPRSIPGPMRLIDLAPTVLELAGLPPYHATSPMDGLSLLLDLPYPRMVLAMNGYTKRAGGKPTFFSKWNRSLRQNSETDQVRSALEGLGYI